MIAAAKGFAVRNVIVCEEGCEKSLVLLRQKTWAISRNL